MELQIAQGPTRCPACGTQVAVPFFDGGTKPLATLAWPQTEEAARALKKLPNDFVRCVACGHVYNPAFDYDEVPYVDKPNLMFNRGVGWSKFLGGVREKLAALLGENPLVVEIGHGDGSFLGALAQLRPQGRFVGFDPHGAVDGAGNVELRSALFMPGSDLAGLRPDLIISRHVLEHLLSPLQFLQQIGYAASCAGLRPAAYFEVPCIDRAIASRRSVDFYYEHSSQFTTQSFTTMLQHAQIGIEELGHGYDGEVIWAIVRFGEGFSQKLAAETGQFRAAAVQALATIGGQLAQLHAQARRVAVWGGTGKSAAFMCRYGVDAKRFPVVVESDRAKVGSYVPGTGQRIEFRDYLRDHPVDVLIIPPQWRARDILAEMAGAGISVASVLIEHGGKLIDFRSEPHPYG